MSIHPTLENRVPDAKNAKYFGFTLQFPAAYDQTFYTTTESDRASWVKTIEEASGVRRFGDFYDLREKIGEGRFAEVYRVGWKPLGGGDVQCIEKKSRKEYAVKVIAKSKLTEKEAQLIQTEIANLSLVQHPNIVTLIETFESPHVLASLAEFYAQHMYIVMELLRGGELYSNICGRAILSELEAYQIIAPLTNCLCYLHNMGIIHRDIKPENILCNSSLFDVKIADFGFSKLIFPREKLDYPCGTLNYIGLAC